MSYTITYDSVELPSQRIELSDGSIIIVPDRLAAICPLCMFQLHEMKTKGLDGLTAVLKSHLAAHHRITTQSGVKTSQGAS